jgi:hypothetical protein
VVTLADNGDPAFEFQYDGSGLTHSDIEAVPDKRSPSLFSAEGVGLARGFWLVVLLLFNLVLWAGLGWMVVLHPK